MSGRQYTVAVYSKGILLEPFIWTGRAGTLIDAFDQARRAKDSTKHWGLFICYLREVSD